MSVQCLRPLFHVPYSMSVLRVDITTLSPLLGQKSNITLGWAGQKGPYWDPRRLDFRKLWGDHPGTRIRRSWLSSYHCAPAFSPQGTFFRDVLRGSLPVRVPSCHSFSGSRRQETQREEGGGGTFQLKLGPHSCGLAGEEGPFCCLASWMGPS